jgi:hypothetical protein
MYLNLKNYNMKDWETCKECFLREKKGWKAKLAALLRVSEQSIYSWFREGNRPPPWVLPALHNIRTIQRGGIEQKAPTALNMVQNCITELETLQKLLINKEN